MDSEICWMTEVMTVNSLSCCPLGDVQSPRVWRVDVDSMRWMGAGVVAVPEVSERVAGESEMGVRNGWPSSFQDQ